MKQYTDEEWKAIEQCDHNCTSNCRREGCNCACGEYHITPEELKNAEEIQKSDDYDLATHHKQ